MNKSTKIQRTLILILALSLHSCFEMPNLLENLVEEEVVDEMVKEKNPIHMDNTTDSEKDDLDGAVSIENPDIYYDDQPVDLPYTLTSEYHWPETEKFKSVQEYWEKEILFLKWDSSALKPFYAMDTEKPVYKPGEIVRATILFYDRFTFKPISFKEVGFTNPVLKLLDANRKAKQTFELQQHVDAENESSVYPKFNFKSTKISSVVEFKLDSDFAGGFYTWELSSDNIRYKERTNFFVSSYRNVKESLILDFNKDALLAGDDIMAKVTLKLLGNDAVIAETGTGGSSDLEFTYKVVDDTGKELESKTKKMNNKTGYIVYQTPADLGNVRSLDVLVSLNYNGNELNATKKLMVTDIESVRVDFTPSGGKYTIGMENEIYFQVYADTDRSVPIEIDNGSVVKLCYDDTEPDINIIPYSGGTSDNNGNGGDIMIGVPEPEPGVDFGEPEPEPMVDGMANEGRILESEPELSFWDKFLRYFTSMIDKFMGLDDEGADSGKGEVDNNEKEQTGIWLNEHGLKTKAGLHLAKTNNYSKLPQNKYSTKKILDAGMEVITMIKSNEDGKGSFKMKIEQDCSYYMSVTQSNYYTHFLMVNASRDFYFIDHSDIRLQVNKRVFEHNETLEIKVTKPESLSKEKDARIVFQRNGHIIKEEVVTYGACVQEEDTKLCHGSLNLPVSEFNSNDGGAFTVQVYCSDNFEYPEQEALVYVYPKNVLKIEKQYNKTLYMPGDTVELDLKIDDNASTNNYFYRVIVSDESAFLQLEKRNLPPTLLTKVFLEKELRGVDGVLQNSHAYMNWMFENNSDILQDEYLIKELDSASEVANELKTSSKQKLEKLLGNQRWRQMFLSASEMRNFLQQVGNSYNYWAEARDYFDLDYWVGCSRHMVYDQNFEGKLAALLPFSTQEIIDASGWRYGGGGFGGGEIMFDDAMVAEAMPEMEEVMADGAKDDRSMEPMADEETTATSASNDQNSAPPEETGNASTEANNNIDLETEMIKENTVFFTSLGWNSADKVTFTLPDDVSKFRVTVLAISEDGRYGLHTDFVSSQKKFDVNVDTPLYVYGTETVNLDITLYNNDFENITVSNGDNSETWNIDANSLKRISISVPSSDFPKNITFSSSNGESEEVSINPTVKKGLNFRHSATLMVREAEVSINDPINIQLPQQKEEGSVKMQLRYTPMGAPVILSGYEQLIQEPYGCFEQTSSTTFPMVILMQYLNMQKDVKDSEKLEEMKFKITTNLTKGAKKLLGFETDTGGFEWFGESPGHVTLTAYGLWQFLEMNKIGQYIPIDVIDRTLNWLRGKYSSSKVEFPITQGLDGFGNPPQQISDIYIVFVMSMFDTYQIDYSSIVDPIINKFESGSDSSDSYLLSFVGLLYENMGKKDKANGITGKLIQNQDSETGEFTSVDATITLSNGKSKAIEATAMAILFLIENDSGNYMEQIEKGVDFLTKNMSFGYFYSTQGTVLALKAIVRFSEYMTSVKAGTKKFKVIVDGVTKEYQVEISDDPQQEYPPLVFEEFKDTPKTSIDVQVVPEFELEKNSKYMFSFEYEYGTSSPISVQNSPLKVEMTSSSLSNAERFSVKVTNQVNEQQGMVNVIFYKPSHLKVNLNDLETLRKTGQVDYYELLKDNSEIVFYWRGIGPNSSYQVDLTLANEFDISDSFSAKVGAYLYYDKDGSMVFA